MSWKERMNEFGGGNFTFLSVDGDTIVFIVVGEPVLIKTVYKQREQERIGCPVVTDEGYRLYICGKRVARRLSKHEDQFAESAMMVVRHGEEGDINCRYDVKVVPEPETFSRLVAIRDTSFTPEMIQESIDEARQVLAE